MQPRETILLDFTHLRDGESVNGELCPACVGGPTGERTLSVTCREGRLLWICYRASCGFKGATGTSGSQVQGTKTESGSTRGAAGRWIARESESLDPSRREVLLGRYQIGGEAISKHSLGQYEGRVVLPVHSAQGEPLGCTLRSLEGAFPKSISHVEQGVIAWYTNRTTRTLIIVEDQLSAIRASDYVNSVALLGTNLNQERATEIREAGLRPAYLALDKDAWELSVRYAKQYRTYLGLQLLRLDKDIKDMTDEEAGDLLSNVRGVEA